MAIPTITMSCNSLPLTAIETAANNCELDTTTKKFGSGSIKILQGGYIDVAMPSVFNMLTDSWTVEHWFSITALETDNYHHLINADNNDTNGQWAVYVDKTGKLTLNRRGGAANTSTVAVANNEWHHLRVTHTGNKTLKAYLDGNLFATNTFSSAPDSMRIGKTLGESTRWYTGNIDEIALTILDASNVAEYSGDTAPVPTEGYPDEGTSGGTGVVINGLFLSTSKPTANQKGLLVNNKFFIPFAESSGSSGGTSAEYYKCASVDTSAKTWSGYKAVFDSGTGTWSFSDTVTEGLSYTSVTPIVGGIYSADALIKISSMWNGVPSENLVFYLPLSETTIADVGPELTASGTIVHTVMNGIQCAYFNGSSYLRASAVSMPTGASPRALSLWFRYKDIPGTTVSDAAVFAGWGTTTSLGRFDVYVEAQELYIIYSSVELKSNIKIQDTNWHHVLLQYDGSTSEIYYDGQLAASEAKTLDTRNNYLYVGARENGEYAFDGYLAGIRIYNRAMTGTEIAYLASEFTSTT